MDRLTWKGGQLLVGVVVRVPVLMRSHHRLAKAVRAVIWDIQEERLIVVLLEEIQRVFGNDIGGIALLLVDFPLPDRFVIVERVGLSRGFCIPVAESLLWSNTVA